MAKHEILEDLKNQAEQIEQEVIEAMEGQSPDEIGQLYEESVRNFEPGGVVPGTVLDVIGTDVIVDVGYKSEGIVDLGEFDKPDEIKPGTPIEVLLETVEDDSGLIVISKRKADRIRGWEKVISANQEGDVVRGRVMRKIKGGLLVDIGVPVFLPASQVNIRRTGDIGDFIGREVECKIIKIDKGRRNIVVSRRKLLEERREEQKAALMGEIAVRQVRKGLVKNITDFGAFVDLGGIDGLLHITDMSWGRISHPSEMLAIDQDVEVMILNIDFEKEKISLGLKQLTPSPWVGLEERYPIGSRVRGVVVNVMNYGAFVKLEEGVEGLVHISEMSWTRRINHPSELVVIGDTVEIVVLGINMQKEEISLGMKQTEVNPWTLVEEKYPPGTVVRGRVRNMTSYGAFIEIEEGIDGLLHVSDMSWTRKVKHPSEIVKKGERVEAIVLSVDREKKRVALGLKQLGGDPWDDDIPGRFKEGDTVKGKVVKFTKFGVFVELAEDLEGLLHISEISDRKVENPESLFAVGQELELMVIRVDREERKIGLSLRQLKQYEGLTAKEYVVEGTDRGGQAVPAGGITIAVAGPGEEEPAVAGPGEEEPAAAAPPAAEAAPPTEEAKPAEPAPEPAAEAAPPTDEVKPSEDAPKPVAEAAPPPAEAAPPTEEAQPSEDAPAAPKEEPSTPGAETAEEPSTPNAETAEEPSAPDAETAPEPSSE